MIRAATVRERPPSMVWLAREHAIRKAMRATGGAS